MSWDDQQKGISEKLLAALMLIREMQELASMLEAKEQATINKAINDAIEKWVNEQPASVVSDPGFWDDWNCQYGGLADWMRQEWVPQTEREMASWRGYRGVFFQGCNEEE